MSAEEHWRVTLPRGAEQPFRVFVNGIPQAEGTDYEVHGRQLLFDRPLEKEQLNVWRWAAIFLALFGTYGKNDSVDVQYQLSGRTTVATGLEISSPTRDAGRGE